MRNKISFAVLLMLGFVWTAPMADAAKKAKEQTDDVDTYEMLNLFGEVMERAKVSYVDEVSDKKLIESAINGMLSAIDPQTSYLEAQSFK